jgi:NAD(P)H-hydrate epimerase
MSMCGAACFAASAAYRCGAGVVEIFTERNNYSSLGSKVPDAVFSLYGYDENAYDVLQRLRAAISYADAVVLGCGIGRSELSERMVECVLENSVVPTVIDADALNIVSEDIDLLDDLPTEQSRRTVITPHPREMSRLCKMPIEDILNDPTGVSYCFAGNLELTCLLKDNKTAISDGEDIYVNQSGNPGMASAGMGDVLAGIIGGLMAQRCLLGLSDSLYIAALAAYIHGVCGDLAAEKVGQYSLLASDIIEQIPRVITRDIMKK